jgi:hypothetical protein
MTTTDNTSQEPVNSECSMPSDEPAPSTPKKPQKGRDFYDLPLEEQHELERKERVTIEYLQAQKNGKVYGARKRAADALGVKERRMHDIAIGYQAHRTDEATRHRPGAEFFLDGRGRPPGATSSLSAEMNLAIELALHERHRMSVYDDGNQQLDPLPPGIVVPQDVYDYVKAIYPDVGSLSSVRRAVGRFIEDNPGYYKLLLEGENALRRNGMPKLPSDVKEVDQNWYWDACDLPLFVNHNGIICRVVLLDIADQFSDYRIYHRILPMRDVDDETEVVKAVHFTIEDAARLVATALYVIQRRPLWLYNDRDARFRHLLKKGYLAQLTEPEETPLRMHMSKPGEPWGRNYKEGTYGALLQSFLRQYGKAYYTKRTKHRVKKNLKLSELRTPEQIEDDFRKFFENVNDLPRNKANDKRSRREVYFAGIPARAAPPIRRLFRLPFETDEGWVPLDDEGFSFPKTSTPYIPMTADRNQFPDMFEDWTNVALSANPMVHYYAVHLDIGWRVEIKLGDTWYEAIPRKECDISVAEREKAKNEVIKRWKKQMAENHARTKAAVLERVTDLPVRHNTRVVDRYELPDHQAETADAAERNTAEDGQGASQQQTSSGGSGTGGKKKPQIDWSDL